MLEKLKPIKQNVDISLGIETYFYLVLIFALFVFTFTLVVKFLKRPKKRISKYELARKYLKNLPLDNLEDKQIAYQFTKYGRLALNPYFEDEFVAIVRQLEAFKYKKTIPKIDNDLKEQIKEYIKVRV